MGYRPTLTASTCSSISRLALRNPFPVSISCGTNLRDVFALTRVLKLAGQSKICDFAHQILIYQHVSCGEILRKKNDATLFRGKSLGTRLHCFIIGQNK
jgi:hypothetical protein